MEINIHIGSGFDSCGVTEARKNVVGFPQEADGERQVGRPSHEGRELKRQSGLSERLKPGGQPRRRNGSSNSDG